MKYWSIALLIILFAGWIFASQKWIGSKKTNSVRIETTSAEFVSPTPTIQITEMATIAAVLAATPSSAPIYPKVTPAPKATSSSFIIASPTISVLRY